MIFKNLKTISKRNLKLLPQSAIKGAFIDKNDNRNAIWDMLVTKEGRCFFSVCAELYVHRSAGLYEYIYETNEIKCCFELDNMVLYEKDAIMPSKIHTSMSEMNDGRISPAVLLSHVTSCFPSRVQEFVPLLIWWMILPLTLPPQVCELKHPFPASLRLVSRFPTKHALPFICAS